MNKLYLLITDLRLPGISGLELIRRVQSSNPQTRTILITAYGNDKVKAEACRLAVYRCFDKPFVIDGLLNTVREVLADDTRTASNTVARRQADQATKLSET